MSEPRTVRGGCACGAVVFEVPDEFAYALICHCSKCRRRTGSAFKPFGGIPVGAVRVTEGEGHLQRFGDGIDHDLSCGTCGSLLWSVVRDGEWAHVAYGTLIDAPSRAPGAHIHTASRAPWETICDDLPQFETLPA